MDTRDNSPRRSSNQMRRDSAERLVVINLLGQARGRRRLALYRHIRDHDQETINHAIAQLVDAGILTTSGDRAILTRAVVHLEALSLIAV